jgi:hypothetical protein
MSRRELSEVSEAAQGLPCAFRDDMPCERQATTYVEWDVEGLRERQVYCGEHAARLLNEHHAQMEHVREGRAPLREACPERATGEHVTDQEAER